MIEIEILESPHFDQIGIHQRNLNEIFIGHNRGDIIIYDDGIMNFHFRIQVTENGKIYGFLNPKLNRFLHNSKMAQGKISLKINDTFKIGATEIKIISALYVPEKSYKQRANEALDQLIQTQDPFLETIKSLEKEMK